MLVLVLTTFLAMAPAEAGSDLTGAWKHVREDGTVGAWIITDDHFSIAWYRSDPAKFISTEGGAWSRTDDGGIRLTYEFDTAKPNRVGTSRTIQVDLSEGSMSAGGAGWTRIDDGAPGALQGSWLMTGRKRDGEISTRRPGARRTMKILSGTRFQWIAYNVETKEFFGSGGGTYSTVDGKYTENIEFFSRDDTRTGRSLEFQYDMVESAWHHIGKSTAGEPMHEVWSRRKDLGI
jgi:hypothetical protein